MFDDIPEHFTGIYSKLYNSVGDKEELNDIKKEIEEKIIFSELEDVDRHYRRQRGMGNSSELTKTHTDR